MELLVKSYQTGRRRRRMLAALAILPLLVGFVSCRKAGQEVTPENLAADDAKVATGTFAAGHLYIATCNMANDKIEVYNSADYPSFDSPGALIFSWKPTTALGYTTAEIDAWGSPYGVARRESTVWSGTTQVGAAVCRDGLATIFRFVGGTVGQKLWARNVGYVPHGIDVLPNGNVAIAGRGLSGGGTSGWIRVYASSQGSTNGTYANYNLDWAHAVLWDTVKNRLWATGEVPGAGTDILVALKVQGTAAAPTLSEDLTMRDTLPTGGGHDISAYYYDTNKLLITTNNGVYSYDKAARTFSPLPGAAFRTMVKSISNQPIGDIVQAKPNTGCTLNGWCTATVDFFNGTTGALAYTRTRTGAAFYKADTWWWAYQ